MFELSTTVLLFISQLSLTGYEEWVRVVLQIFILSSSLILVYHMGTFKNKTQFDWSLFLRELAFAALFIRFIIINLVGSQDSFYSMVIIYIILALSCFWLTYNTLRQTFINEEYDEETEQSNDIHTRN